MLSRRSFLERSMANGVVVLGGTRILRHLDGESSLPAGLLDAPDAVRDGRVREISLRAQRADWDAGNGRIVNAWTFNGRVPGPVISATEGDLVRATLINDLPEPTTIHWHGIPVPFAMDGVPEMTQPAVPPGQRFVYEFLATVPGTYWYHSHFGYQFERGLFGSLIVAPRSETLSYDREYTLVLDDWLNDPEHAAPSAGPYNMSLGGVSMGTMQMRMDDPAGIPDTGSSAPAKMGSMPGMPGMGRMTMGGGRDTASAKTAPMSPSHGAPMREPVFDAFTINGLTAPAHPALAVRRGDRVRVRFVNASTATVFPIYLAGHRFTVTHLDGQPVTPFETDVMPIGMGERVDVLVTANNPGAWRLGSTEPRHRSKGFAFVVRYDGVRPDAAVQDAPLPSVDPRPYARLLGNEDRASAPADRAYSLSLRQEGPSMWTINGRAYPDSDVLDVRRGERVRLRITNNSMYAHPVHLHGHFFNVVRPYGGAVDVARPLRKDTLTLYHMDTHVLEFTADNPGARWFLHCHNQYHHVGGMAVEVRYV